MNDAMARRLAMTAGEARMMYGYAMAAFFGAVFAAIVVVRLDASAILMRPPTPYEIWIMVSGAIGAALGVRVARPQLGMPGLSAPLWGMVTATFVAPVIAGTLGLPLYGTMFGPFTMLVIFFASPALAVLWFAMLGVVHFLAMAWHDERDSIFGRPIERAEEY